MDFYELKIFCQVMNDKTFSKAAQSLKITQPNVSQQISKLETKLEGKLFVRVSHQLIPTQLAQDFFPFALPLMESIETFEDRLMQRKESLKGVVRYAMPESCQWTPHYRKIMSQIKEFPDLNFKIEIAPNEVIVKNLIEARIDFGFVVGERLAPELRFEKYADEFYSAVALEQKMFQPLKNKDDFNNLRLVTYPGWEVFFTTWAKSNGLWAQLKKVLREPTLFIGTLAGAIHAIQEGAGLGIIPTHCVLEELSSGELCEWKASKPVSNPIYIAKRVGEKLPRRVELVIDLLKKAKSTEV